MNNASFSYRRSHDCGTLRKEHIGQKVTLSGWVNRRRDHGGLIFIDLRDRFGITQLVFDPQIDEDIHAQANRLRSEWVLSIEGNVIPRAEGMANPNLATGDIEVEVRCLNVLSRAKTPPFSLCEEDIDVHEELRLKYRYLDIRRGNVAQNLVMRHRAMQATREYLNTENFIEVQTPLLGPSTPEGARDYLVPSRIYPGHFYALPQSPQLFKQLLMVSGMDRYYQIAPCLRDEDLRADRQPEFSQIDLEMSFCTVEDLFPLIEGLMARVFQSCLNVDIQTNFRKIPYRECIEKYGTDKPDLRFGMPLVDISDIAQRSSFSVFLDQLQAGNIVKGLCVKGGATLSRKNIDFYTSFVGQLGIKGLAWMKLQEGKLSSSIVKFFSEELQKELKERLEVEEGDLLFFVADTFERTHQALDHLRRKLARDRNLIPPHSYEFLWVVDFPLFSWNPDEQRLESEQHPFTAPMEEDISLLADNPLQARSSGYDLVLNGYELASGSQRIHDPDMQERVFSLLNLSPEEAQKRFGFFVEALQYGTPPHLGAAIGVERLVMILCGTENIRDVVAFPKTQKASDLMSQSPSSVDMKHLDELRLVVQEHVESPVGN